MPSSLLKVDVLFLAQMLAEIGYGMPFSLPFHDLLETMLSCLPALSDIQRGIVQQCDYHEAGTAKAIAIALLAWLQTYMPAILSQTVSPAGCCSYQAIKVSMDIGADPP